MKILCIGQSAYDITLPVPDYPIENRKIKIGNSKIESGGGACNNAAYLLGLWNSDVYLASSIGKDFYGERIKEELKKVHVNTTYFEEHDNIETTTSYIIANTTKGTRTIITNKNPLMKFNKLTKIDMKPEVILVDGNDYELALNTLKENKDAITIIDAGSIKEGTIDLCKNVKYVLCSNDFAREYTKINFTYDNMDELIQVHQKLEQDFQNTVVITLESKGCFTKIDNQYVIVPSISVKSVDSTGAGDIFHGAFTYFIANNYSFYDSLRLANIAGALSVTKIGSKNSMPLKEEVLKYYGL